MMNNAIIIVHSCDSNTSPGELLLHRVVRLADTNSKKRPDGPNPAYKNNSTQTHLQNTVIVVQGSKENIT